MTAYDADPVTSAADPDLVTPDADDMESLMMTKARELFEVCDVERKGFITKRDMQRLQKQMPMSAEQLADVFDSFDEQGNGYVTIDDFTQGFGAFLGIASSSAIEKRKSPEGHVTAESVYENDHVGAVVRDEEEEEEEDDDEDMRRTLNEVFTTNQDTGIDVENARRLWRMLRSDRHRSQLLDSFESFLGCVARELKRSHADYRSLEAALRNKNILHDEEMKRLYEEMETQISMEKQKALAEERAKERHLKEEMETEMREKDRKVNELVIHRKQLQEKLNDMNDQEVETKQENIKLQTAKDKLEQSLIVSQHLLEESQAYANQLRSQEKEVKYHQTLATLHVSEGIALERESLVKQLDLLRAMNRKLRDETEEAELRRMRTNRRS